MNDLIVDVKLWGESVGSLYWEKESNAALFDYERKFIRSGLDISPIIMPISQYRNTPYRFLENRTDCFKGLPGLFADSLPDTFGNQIINEWFASKGLSGEEITPLDRLCYVGKRGMGALEFEPSSPINGMNESSVLHIEELTELAKSVFTDRMAFQVQLRQEGRNILDILKVGTSAGGAKPKAIIAYNDITGEVRSGQVKAPEGFGYWLLKFDGGKYSEHTQITDNPQGIGNIEYAYHRMAKACGIDMMECRLLQEKESYHFMTRRFDRMEDGEKIHVQTLAGLAHYDRDQRHSYEEIFRIMRQMNLPYPEQEELYRRMVFNVMSRNHDDHSKNLSFLMDRQGKWKLAPAYDLCYSYTPGGKWTNRHQLSLNGKQDNFTMEDLQKVGENMGIRKHKQIIEEIQETVSHWHETAKDCGVKPEHADFIGENLLLFGKQLHTIHMPDIANEQEQAFMKAMRNDDFNTGNSLLMIGAKMGMDVRIGAPKAYWPSAEIIALAEELAAVSGAHITITEDPNEAVAGVDFIHTDIWVSMGEPAEVWAERIALLKPYQVNAALMAASGNPQVKFMHCLPAYHNDETKVGANVIAEHPELADGVEVTEEVFESPASIVFEQAGNRMHTIKALMVATLA